MHAEVDNSLKAIGDGGLLLYPTDTVWGLGCDATNAEAVQKIINLKGRPGDKSFIVLVNSDAMLEQYVEQVPEVCWDLLDASDSPMTIIYPKGIGFAPQVCAADGSIAIRLTKDPFCRSLIQKLRKPLISTSANLSGSPTPQQFSEIAEELIQQVDYVVNLRRDEPNGPPSAILKVGLNGEISIIRK